MANDLGFSINNYMFSDKRINTMCTSRLVRLQSDAFTIRVNVYVKVYFAYVRTILEYFSCNVLS